MPNLVLFSLSSGVLNHVILVKCQAEKEMMKAIPLHTSKTAPDELITDVVTRSELILSKQMLSDINKTIN